MNLRIKRVRDVKLPSRGTEVSAGLDFFVPNDFTPKILFHGESVNIPSGIKVEIPHDFMLCAFNKSGVAVNKLLVVGACVVDEDYQGEVHLHVINNGLHPVSIQPGDKLVQFILIPVWYVRVEEVESIHEQSTARGAGGFGSTGTR
jgi:dUTP pyrophosphatase